MRTNYTRPKPSFLLVLIMSVSFATSAQNTYPWPSNQNIGIGTTSPLAPLHVKNTVALFGTIAGQDAVRSGAQAQALNTFLGADNNRVAYFGQSWSNFVIQNEMSTSNPSQNVVAVSPNGVTILGGFSNYGQTLQVHGTGYIQSSLGIGTTNPNASLEARGTILATSLYNNAGVYITGDNGNYGSIQATNSSNSAYKNLVLQEYDGNVAIGTNDPKGYRLAVNGPAIFTQAKVKLNSNWPDYVFRSNYRLPSLKEVDAFIKKYHHLPEVPSAKEAEENGIDLGSNQAILLKKIEELTLYMIELNKRIDEQKTLVEQQQKLIADQAKMLEQIRQTEK